MRLERLTYNKIRIFLTTDDLAERGLTKEDIWKDSLKWHQLFYEMLEEASNEYGVDIHGSVAVEIFSMHAQGMIMIVTVEEQEDERFLSDGIIDVKINDQDNEVLLFEFTDIEDVIQLSKRLSAINFWGGSLYEMNNIYYLLIEEYPEADSKRLAANLAEYGDVSLESKHRLKEYGKLLLKESAVENLLYFFQ